MSLHSARTLLVSILEQLPATRPLPPDALQAIVSRTITNNPMKSTFGWDTCLKREATAVVSRKSKDGGQLDGAYFEELFIRLDIALTCADLEAAEASLPLNILYDLFEMHTVDACIRIFEWLESRSARLTKNMVPSRGKALVLLKQLNSLVRRVSKTGDTAKFNGRILNFLSGAFPLGERSGVNLRGDYGPQWEDVPLPPGYVPPEERAAITAKNAEGDSTVTPAVAKNTMEGVESSTPDTSKDVKMSTDPPALEQTAEDQRVEFYQTFWSVQKPFSNPSLFQNTDMFGMFRANVSKIIHTLTEATKRDRLSSTSKSATPPSAAGAKRKRDETDGTSSETSTSVPPQKSESNKDYFFAKFLTNYDLLELEIADIHFRRQIIIQILILCNYLRTYAPAEKEKWAAKARGPRRMEFTLSDEDTKWLRETWDKCQEELRTPIGGLGFRTFQDTVTDLLDRERAWARWKNDGCASFEKPPLARSEFEEVSAKRRTFLEPIPPLAHALGTEDLTDTWESGYNGPDDLEFPPRHTSFDRYVRDYKALNKKIEMKEKQLTMLAARKAVPVPAPAAGKPVVPERTATPPPTTSVPLATITSPPHGLPPKPVNPLGILTRPNTPSVAATLPVAQVAPLPMITPAPKVVASPQVKLSDPQLEAFLDQQEILVWRGLRAAAQEGYLHQLNKTKDKDPGALGDLEKLQTKIQNAEAEAEAAAAAAKPTSAPAPTSLQSLPPVGPTEDSKTEDAGGGPMASSLMDVDSKMDQDTKVKIEASALPAPAVKDNKC